MNINAITNMIDEAMSKYDIDTRSCLARTMCEQMKAKSTDIEENPVYAISQGLLSKLAE